MLIHQWGFCNCNPQKVQNINKSVGNALAMYVKCCFALRSVRNLLDNFCEFFSKFPSSFCKSYHAHGNQYISSSRQCFDVYVFALNTFSLSEKIFHICAFTSDKRKSCQKRELCVSNSNSMVLRFFHACVCVLNS